LQAVEETVYKVTTSIGECSWKVLRRPATYHLVFSGCMSVTDKAIEICAEHTYVDFEGGSLVAIVPKHTPDILY
jgi:hypothetical protein